MRALEREALHRGDDPPRRSCAAFDLEWCGEYDGKRYRTNATTEDMRK